MKIKVTRKAIKESGYKVYAIGYCQAQYLLNDKKPIAVGPLDLQSHLFEHKRDQAQAMINAKQVILDVSKEFEKATGRKYELFEKYMLDDAEIAIVVINSTAGTTKAVINELRQKGIKAGLYRPITIRPLAVKPLRDAVSRAKHILFTESANGQLAQMVLEKIYGLTTPYSTLFKMGVGVTGDDIVSKVESIVAKL